MLFALTVIAVVLALSIPVIVYLVGNIHKDTLAHLERVQVIGGQPVRLAEEQMEFVHEQKTAERKERAARIRTPDQVVGN